MTLIYCGHIIRGQSEEEVKRVVQVMQNPLQYKIPKWFLNRQKDPKDGSYSHALANDLNTKLRGMYLSMLITRLATTLSPPAINELSAYYFEFVYWLSCLSLFYFFIFSFFIFFACLLSPSKFLSRYWFGLVLITSDDFERMKKMRLHRGIRHMWG